MKLVLLIGIVIVSLYILSDDKKLFEKIRSKLHNNRSIQLLILLIMFYLIYNDYPLYYTIPFTLFFLFTLYNGKLSSFTTNSKILSKISNKFSNILEGFKSILDDPDQRVEEVEEEEEEKDEDDKKKMINELLEELDKDGDEYDILMEAHGEEEEEEEE